MMTTKTLSVERSHTHHLIATHMFGKRSEKRVEGSIVGNRERDSLYKGDTNQCARPHLLTYIN
jgi:hypothetical protein